MSETLAIVPKVVGAPTKKGKKKKKKSKAVPVVVPQVVAVAKKAVQKKVNREVSALIRQPQQVGMGPSVAILKSLTCPKDNPPIRWASKYSSMPTATASPWSIVTAPWAAGVTTQTTKQLPVNQMIAFVFRCAERSMVIYDHNPTEESFVYQFYGIDVAHTVSPTPPSISFRAGGQGAGGVLYGTVVPLKIPYAVPTSSYAPHGAVWFAGKAERDEMRRFFWLDGSPADSVVDIDTSCDPADTYKINIILDRLTDEGVQLAAYESGLLTEATPGGQIAVLESGYYAFSAKVTDNSTSGTVMIDSLTYTSTTSTFRHLCMPHYELNTVSADGIRVIGASMMYTNQAAVLNLQGKCVGVQLPVEHNWTDYISSTAVSQLASLAQAETKRADNGIYGFLKPTQPHDFDVQRYTQVVNGVLVDSFYPILHDSAFLGVGVQIDDGAGQDGYFTFSYNMEYQTTDTWREITASPYEEQTYDVVLRMLKDMQQWYENPLHLKQILSGGKKLLSGAARGVMRYGPGVVATAAKLAPLLL
jgi:hypothetical protein